MGSLDFSHKAGNQVLPLFQSQRLAVTPVIISAQVIQNMLAYLSVKRVKEGTL
jgi:hypothetical protein